MVEALFLNALPALGGRPDGAARTAYAALADGYRGRPYHDLGHVQATLDIALFLEEDLDPADAARVVLALFYHDAVYDPKASDNEARSAAMAREALAPLGIEAVDLDEIERLILVTRDHRADDPLGRLVVDADLAILQAAPEAYDRYAAAIRREYAFVPEAAYREGRTRVLRGLLARDPLFTSPLLDETAARANLEREIARLAEAPL